MFFLQRTALSLLVDSKTFSPKGEFFSGFIRIFVMPVV